MFEFLSKLSGINILFDEEVKAQPVTVFVKDVSFQYALNLLLSTNKLFMKKISADTIIIIPKSKAKTDQYQDLMVKTFYINNAKSKEIVNLVRSMLDVKKGVRERNAELHHRPRHAGKDEAGGEDHRGERPQGSGGHPRRGDPRDLEDERAEVRLEFPARPVPQPPRSSRRRPPPPP